MKKSGIYFTIILSGLILCLVIPLPAQFITIARKIKNMKSDKSDVATVILDAGASAVFKAIMDTVTSQPKCRIVQRDNSRKLVEFTNGTNSFTMQVDSLAIGLSQITVMAVPSGDTQQKPADAAVKAILSVCHKVGLQCTVKDSFD
jgi:hypothetical protein